MFPGNNTHDNTIGWIGNGSVLFTMLDANDRPTGGYFNIGQCSTAVLALASEKIEMMDMQFGTRGVAMSQTVSSTGTLTINCKNFSPDVLALALFGSIVEDSETENSEWAGKAYKGRSIVVDGIIKSVESVTTADATELEAGVDYIVSNGNIHFTEDANITDEEEVEVLYTKAKARRIEGFISSDVRVGIVFDGINMADENKPVKVTYHKVSLSPAAQRQLLNTEYGDQELTGAVEVSRAVTGSGLSRMFREEHAA